MFRYLRLKREDDRPVLESGALIADQIKKDVSTPISLRQLNGLPENTKKRLYRALIPPFLLIQYGIDPFTWVSKEDGGSVLMISEPEKSVVNLAARKTEAHPDYFFQVELADNAFNGIDLNLILLNDPDSPFFRTDIDQEGEPTLFGTLRRNLAEEERAMRAGLAPGQVRSSLGASRLVLQHIEAFILSLGHRALFLEPLTYASAWVFEQRGFAYVRGHKLMDDIHREFQTGGALHAALDGRTPFRQPGAGCSVRGRAWAIHDGILEAIGSRWNDLRMIKQVGRSAGVDTFPGAIY